MNWNQLQYVITVAQEKSITKAARKLFISQPSLSLSIQALEKETGVTLFCRERGETALTYAGTLFYEWALSTLHSRNLLQTQLNDISQERRSLIRIGMSPHRSLVVLPQILNRFCAEIPNSEIHIIEKPTYILKKLLENNELDFMIDVMHPDTLNYQSELLTKERIVLAVPSSFAADACFPPVKDGSVSLSDLAPYPFILLSAEQIIGKMSRRMCEAASFYPDVRLICEHVETALSMVNRQLGITFIPEILTKQSFLGQDIRCFHIQQFYDTRQLCLVYPKNRYQHTHLTRLLELFREMVPKLYETSGFPVSDTATDLHDNR